MTFQELIDTIIVKSGQPLANDCTTQIAFYKVRRVMVEELGIDKERIQRNAALKDLFPKRIRKRNLGIIGNQLGIQIDYFQAPGWFQLAGAAALIASFVLLFFNELIGACTFIFTLSLTFIANTWGVTLPMNTLGDLVERITMDNLMKLREDKSSINPKEIRMTILKRIDHLQGLEKRELAPEQKIVFG